MTAHPSILQPAVSAPARPKRTRLRSTLLYFKRNPNLAIGLFMLIALIVFTIVGLFQVDIQNGYAGAVRASQPPSAKYLFGTDGQGRDMYTVAVLGTWVTLEIGFIAAAIGMGLGVFLGFSSAYFGGWIDSILRWVIDVFMKSLDRRNRLDHRLVLMGWTSPGGALASAFFARTPVCAYG